MGSLSKIAWTDATWNPTTGCSIVSPGCHHCYAMTMAKRLRAMGRKEYQDVVDDQGRWTGVVNAIDARLEEPLTWRKPRMVFVDSMSDLFHENVSDAFIVRVFETMAQHPGLCRKKHEHDYWGDDGDGCEVADWNHVYQVLTKRPKRMAELVPRIPELADELWGGACAISIMAETGSWPLPNVWLGTSVEDQKRYDERIDYLVNTPAAVRFISFEPLLGPIELRLENPRARFDWAIIGCESINGRSGRGCLIGLEEVTWRGWARDLLAQCNLAGVPVFVKQIPIGGQVSHDVNQWGPPLRVRRWPAALPETFRQGQPA